MDASNINKLGKKEKNAKIKEGPCIFPFKYKHKTHNECYETEKGFICATEVNEKRTLKKYGYCAKKRTEKKTPPKTLKKKYKLNIVEEFPEKMKSKSPEVSSINITMESNNKRLNEEFISIMQELNDIMMKQGEPFRARAYSKAMESIMAIDEDITDYKQLKDKPGIGKTIYDKLEEYQKTGTLKVLERERKNPLNVLTNVYGIGPKKAKELIKKDITTIEDLKKVQNEELNDKQIIGLKYYDDILERIPRKEIDEYKEVLQVIFDNSAPPNSKMEIVGSYRRGAKNSGDIDIIITNEENNKNSFNNFLDTLIKDKVVIEVLSRGSNKSLTIGQLPGKTPRRLDFLYTAPDEYAFAVLYFTGSKAFNTVMRNRALKHGYTLNEHGLSIMESGKKGKKIDIKFPDEKSIFTFLNMEYKEPEQRKDGRAVVPLEIEIVPQTEIKIKDTSPKNKTLKKKTESKTTLENIKNFQKNGIDELKLLSKKELENILSESSNQYYNENKFIMTDNEYDIVKEYIEKKYPKSEELKKIGAPVEKNKVSLPYFMPSMDKIKPSTNAIAKWNEKYKGPYVLSAKLDGISALYSTENNESKLFTRGDGKVGQDISYMIPYLKLPSYSDPITIRGELIMQKKEFEEKYSNKFANARNLVSGIVGSKKIDEEKYKSIDFVGYEVLAPELNPSDQMTFLKKLDVNVVINKTENKVSNELLSEVLIEWRSSYIYEIDGIIVCDDKIYPRTENNPEHSFAFKMVLLDQIAEAKVLNVLWSPSKDGYLKPRIQIEPIELGGVKIEYATAFNASFVEDNKLGIGALVKIIRSGDVIPYIQEVVQQAQQAKMPEEDYVWNSTHIDIMLKNPEENDVVKQKNILSFMTKLEVEGIGPGNIKKIINAGYNSIPKILAMSIDDFKNVENFKEKMATKVYNSIHEKIDNADLITLMVATNIFGRGLGEKKMEPIIQTYPDILLSDETHNEKVEKVLKIKGMANKSANLFVDNIEPFVNFMNEAKLEYKLNEGSKITPADTSGPLYDKKVVMTGFRDKQILEFLKSQGANIMTTVNKNTELVIIKSKDDMTGKAEMAENHNVPIMTKEQFENEYKK